MEDFDPIGGGFLFERLVDALFSVSGGGIEALLAPLKPLAVILLAVSGVGIIWVAMKIFEFRPKFRIVTSPLQVPPQKFAKMRWEEIIRRPETGLEADIKLAIIEADMLVDEVLKRIGFGGENLGERLSRLSGRELSSFPDLLEAHRVRNSVTHTPGFQLSKSEAERILRKYERVLKELEVI